MATGIECCAACACMQPALNCLLRAFQRLCEDGSSPCIGRDCRVRIQNICSRINIFNDCSCCNSTRSTTTNNVQGTMIQGGGVINHAPAPQSPVVDAVARRQLDELALAIKGDRGHSFEVSV